MRGRQAVRHTNPVFKISSRNWDMLLLPPLSTRWSFANSGRPEHLVIQSLPGLNGYIPNLFVIVFMVAVLMMLLHALTIADFTEIFDDLKLGFTQSSTFVVGGKSSSI
jgi:hypothetical protein